MGIFPAKKVYLNRPQLKAFLIDAKNSFYVMGRGTGKTNGILAPKIRRNIIDMARSAGLFMSATYQAALTRTLPSFISGLERFGILKDIHYVIGHRAPAKWKWPEPFEPPLNYKYFIQFCNGAGLHIISQDMKGSSNGINSDYAVGDEAKLLDWPQFQEETMPTIRANTTVFGKLHNHRGLTFTTSMPTAAQGKWIFDIEKEMDEDAIHLILAYQVEINRLQILYSKSALSTKLKIAREINKLTSKANLLRKGATYYAEASSIENVSILTPEYIADQKRIMPEFIFNTEILNLRPEKVDGGFYPLLDLNKHTYSAFDNSYLSNLEYDFNKPLVPNCKMDGDCIDNLPLTIAVDWGAKINCMSIGQAFNNQVRVIKSMHVLYPEILDHLAKKFCEYYSSKSNKIVYFAYDHTGNTRMANSNLTYSEQFCNVVCKHGFNIIAISFKRPLTHQEKYLQNNRIMHEIEPIIPKVRINKDNCADLLVSMCDAPAKQGQNGIEKNKSSERNDALPQQKATHYSDTFDILIDAMFSDVFAAKPEFFDNIYSCQ